ncbi:MAG: 23S rRNA pseudouridine(2605) synthase RluB [Pseudomonadota bacterium]
MAARQQASKAASKSATPQRASSGRRGTRAASPPADTQKLHKVLAQAGLGSRRAMEELIASGRVQVNGKPAQLGMRVAPDDMVKVGRRIIKVKPSDQARLPRVLIYHKPEGEIVSRDDPEDRPSVFDKLPRLRASKWIAIGRLDFNTCGLLIFTTSGELANRLTHPSFEIEREYAVRIMGQVTPQHVRLLTTGVPLPDGKARFEVLEDRGGRGANHWYRVVLKEGRNRIVRRMFEAAGLNVTRLMRIRFGAVVLPPQLKRGQHLELGRADTRSLMEWLDGGHG